MSICAGNPFVMTKAIGVDMFPHTHHKEMVMLFERTVDEEEKPSPTEIVEKSADAISIPGKDDNDTEMVELERDQMHETPSLIIAANSVSEEVKPLL